MIAYASRTGTREEGAADALAARQTTTAKAEKGKA